MDQDRPQDLPHEEDAGDKEAPARRWRECLRRAGGPEGVWGPGSLKDVEQLCPRLLVGQTGGGRWALGSLRG